MGDDDREPFFTHRNPYDLNSKIMLTAIVSLSFVVVLVIVLHIYARCVLRRQARRRAVIRALDLTVTHAHSTEQPPKRGLDPLVIAALPTFVFKQKENPEEDDATILECAVCLSNLENQEMARLLPNCKHTFHADCIDKWLGSHSTCPICRTQAEPRLQPEPREGPSPTTTTTAVATPTAPPLVPERVDSTMACQEGTSNISGVECSAKVVGSSSRLSSFRRILSRERSSRRLNHQSCSSQLEDHDIVDLERQ